MVLVTRRLGTGGDSNSARSVALIETANLSGDDVSVALLVRVLTAVSAAATLATGISVGASVAASATVGLDSSANTTVLEDDFLGLDCGRPVSRVWHASGERCDAGVLRPPFCGDTSRPVLSSAAPGVPDSRAGSSRLISKCSDLSVILFLGDFGDLGGIGDFVSLELDVVPKRSARRLLFRGDFGDLRGLGDLADLEELVVCPNRPVKRFFCGDSEGGGGGGVGAGGGSGGRMGLLLTVRVRWCTIGASGWSARA